MLAHCDILAQRDIIAWDCSGGCHWPRLGVSNLHMHATGVFLCVAIYFCIRLGIDNFLYEMTMYLIKCECALFLH